MSDSGRKPEAPPARLPWLILAGIGVFILVWTAWFVVAMHHPVAEVPLAAPGR
jgi:hypothetical protein